MNISETTKVKTSEIATVLGLTPRRIQQLTRESVLTKEHGHYNLIDSVKRYMEYRSKKDVLDDTEKERINAEVSIKKARAIVAVMEAKELQGKMHRSEDVAAMTEDLLFSIRGMLLALPGRLAVDTAAASTPPETSEIIRTEIYRIMEEISRYEYDPEKYEARVRERRNWDERTGSLDDRYEEE